MKLHEFGGLSEQAPEWVMTTFMTINIVIALAYGLLAIFFVKRIKLPSRHERHWLTMVACVGAAIFFVGCAHTHIDLAYWAQTDDLKQHWYTWWNVVSHLLQAIGGITFWILATFYLQVSVFDKRHYEKMTALPED